MTPLWLKTGAGLARLLRVLTWRRPALLVLRPGSLGDALLFTGALRALRAQYPQHRIVLAASQRAAPIFERCPHVDELLLIDDNLGNSSLPARIRRTLFAFRVFARSYPMVVNGVTWSKVHDQAYAFTGWWTFLMADVDAGKIAALDCTDTRGRDVHELDLLVKLMQMAGCVNVKSREDIWPEVYLREDERAWAGGEVTELQSYRVTKDGGDEGAWKVERGKWSVESGTTTDQKHSTLHIYPAECGAPHSTNLSPSDLCNPCNSVTLVTPSSAARPLRIALCPGARFKYKAWGTEKYAALIGLIAREIAPCRLTVLLLGGPADRRVCEEIVGKVKGLQGYKVTRVTKDGGGEGAWKVERGKWRVESGAMEATTDQKHSTLHTPHSTSRLPRRLVAAKRSEDGSSEGTKTGNSVTPVTLSLCDSTLYQAMALIEQSDLCIGNDTFGLHAAIALGTPSVVLMWGGDGDRWAPWGDPDRHRMVRAAVDCAGCGGECVKERHECMEAITPEMVWESVGRRA